MLQPKDFQRILLQIDHQHNNRVDSDLLHLDHSQGPDNLDGLCNAGRHGDLHVHEPKPKEEIINLGTKLEEGSIQDSLRGRDDSRTHLIMKKYYSEECLQIVKRQMNQQDFQLIFQQY